MINSHVRIFTFPVLERWAALRLIKLLGFDHFDIGLFCRSTHFSPNELVADPHSTPPGPRGFEGLRVKGVGCICPKLGLTLPRDRRTSGPSIRIKNRETFSKALDFCVAIRCHHLTGLPGVLHAGTSRESDWELAPKKPDGPLPNDRRQGSNIQSNRRWTIAAKSKVHVNSYAE